MFHIFNTHCSEAIISPQLARFESKTFKQIEDNIQKEILDFSECEDTMAALNPSLSDICDANEEHEGTDSLQ